ncbi:MAG: helix-turn-helix transcriptional regulator [Erysipelotrichaceae bacterium]|nr:helix-turn-helix transcriptional regulator [Erysipelotrichaceae bacterium]
MTLQDKIKELRLTNDYTQNDLADALNISRPTLSKWETGVAEPSASDLKKISNLFNVSVDDLLNDQTDNLEKTSDISKWKNSSIIKILLLGLSLALTFASILFDISDIFNAKGNYVKVSLSTIMYTVKDVVLMTAIIIWLRNLIKKQEDLRNACLTVLLFFLCEIAFSIIGFLFLNDIELVSLTHVIFIVFRWIVLPLVCAVSIIIYYKKANYINPSVVVLIYVTRILSGSIGWYRSIYQNRNRLLYFDYSLVNNRIRWWNIVVIFSLFLYCALVLTKERKEKKGDTKLEIK